MAISHQFHLNATRDNVHICLDVLIFLCMILELILLRTFLWCTELINSLPANRVFRKLPILAYFSFLCFNLKKFTSLQVVFSTK